MNIGADNISYFDAILNIMGIIGIWPVIRRICHDDNISPIDRRLKWIFVTFACLMAARIPYLAAGTAIAGQLVYIFAVGIIVTVFLYIETLLRRHMPLWLKLFVTIGSLYFAGISLLNTLPGNVPNLRNFAGFISLTTFFTLSVAILRNHKDYTKIENSLIDITVWVVLILAPLQLSDMNAYGLHQFPRLGVAGILLLIYLSIYNQALFTSRWEVLRKVLKSIVFSILLTAAIATLTHGLDGDTWSVSFDGRVFVLFFIANLIYRIHFAVKHLRGDDDIFDIIKMLNKTDKSKIKNFHLALAEFFQKMDHRVVKPEELQFFNQKAIFDFVRESDKAVFSLHEMRDFLYDLEPASGVSQQEILAVEQIIHLLETYEMTYFLVLGRQKPKVILFNVQMAAYGEMTEIKAKLVSDIAILIEAAESKV